MELWLQLLIIYGIGFLITWIVTVRTDTVPVGGEGESMLYNLPTAVVWPLYWLVLLAYWATLALSMMFFPERVIKKWFKK